MSTQIIIPPDDPIVPIDRTTTVTDKIAEELRLALVAAVGGGYTVVRYGSTLAITAAGGGNPDALDIKVSDTLGGNGLSIIRGSVPSFADLPDEAPNGHILRVTGDPATNADDYWVARGAGRWNECAAPGVNQSLDALQLPWVMTSTGTGVNRQFSFGPAQWDNRAAGDDSNNPSPQFDRIDTIFVTEGRLGFTAGASVSLTASNNPKQLFRSTVAQLLPSDPVHVRSTLGHVGRYHSVFHWDGAVQLWSDRAQRSLYGEPAISPSTVVIAPESSFDNDATCEPVVVGTRVFFARYIDGFTRVLEYFRPPGYDSLPEVRDLTAQVPAYITGQAKMLAADESLGFLAVLPRGAGDSVFVCNLLPGDRGPTPVWHKWTFTGAAISTVRVVGGKLHLLLTRGGGLARVETVDIANPAEPSVGDVTDGPGLAAVTPSLAVTKAYFQSDRGPDATARVTVRNLTVFHRDTRSATLTLTGEATPRLTVSSPISSDPLRVPILRAMTLGGFGYTASWTGFLTTIELQGSYVSRSPRA